MRRFAAWFGVAALLGVLAGRVTPARAADPLPEVPLTVEKKEFKPAGVKVKAGTPFFLLITNKDAAAIEFGSKELRVEKVVPPDAPVKVRMRAPTPGSYPVVDDFHHETSGRIVAE